jgi:AcrR family transcriptional regulator
MSERVRSKRRYESPRRREQAAATRLEILEAAQRLFERDGYAGTTMAAVAAESRVALKTVYVAFETKSGVLRALWNLRLRGDQDSGPIAQHAWYRDALEEPDPKRQLRLNARNSRVGKVRIAALAEVIRSAAPLDPDIEALWDRINTEYHANQRVIVESLHKKGALRTDLDVARATDILYGPSAIPTPGSCSSPRAAGRPSSISNGPATPPAHSSCSNRRTPARDTG